MSWEPERLDDQAFLAENDPSGMLPAVASSAAQIRTAVRASAEAKVSAIAGDGRPRAIVVVGVGASALAGDILAVVCGYGTPLPIITIRDLRLPGWVGAADLLIALSASGATEETLAMTAEGVRRGCRVLGVGKPGSALHALTTQAGGPFVPVPSGPMKSEGQPRASLWSLAIPPLVAAASLGLCDAGDEVLEGVAVRLEDIANRCRPSSDLFINPGKTLAMELAETVPVIWGTSRVTAVAAYRMACQLNENAGYPAVWGELPEAGHNQVSVFEGPLAERDIFEESAARTVRLFVLRDTDEHPQTAKRRQVAMAIAEDRGVPVTELKAEGAHPLERLATLVELADYGSVYLALGYGLDPTSVSAITELQARIAR